jgi:hypothetical protein
MLFIDALDKLLANNNLDYDLPCPDVFAIIVACDVLYYVYALSPDVTIGLSPFRVGDIGVLVLVPANPYAFWR